MSLAFDETGRPFIILREQGKKKRIKGLEAHKVSSQTLYLYFNVSLLFRSIFSQPLPLQVSLKLLQVLREWTRCLLVQTVKSLLQMMEQPFQKKWKSIIRQLNFLSSFLLPKTMRSVMEQLVLLYLLDLFSTKHKNSQTKVSIH